MLQFLVYTLVIEACFSGRAAGGSGTGWKAGTWYGGGGLLPPMCLGLRAMFCRRLLSTLLDVLEARLSRVLGPRERERERRRRGERKRESKRCYGGEKMTRVK